MKLMSNVYLIDHVWAFKQRMILDTLMQEEGLRSRLENLMKYSDKKDLPGKNTFIPAKPLFD